MSKFFAKIVRHKTYPQVAGQRHPLPPMEALWRQKRSFPSPLVMFYKVASEKWLNLFSKFLWRLPERGILAFVQLPQDWDILWLLLRELQERKISVVVLVTSEVLCESPRIREGLVDQGVAFLSIPKLLVRSGVLPRLTGLSGVITASESSAGPHRIAYHLVRRANRRKIETFTIQHGFENIGLTYFDREFPPGSVDFASSSILTWGELVTLDDRVAPTVRERCVPVGLVKAHAGDMAPSLDDKRPVIAIFENLHWTRYSSYYRERFISDVLSVAKRNPQFLFLIKPHHSQRWAAKENRLSPRPENLEIADPLDPKWEPFTAPAMMKLARLAISTPSTAVLDATIVGLPTAVLCYDLDLSKYDPLFQIRQPDDWTSFLQAFDDADYRTKLTALSRDFADRWVVPGPGAVRAADFIVKRLKS